MKTKKTLLSLSFTVISMLICRNTFSQESAKDTLEIQEVVVTGSPIKVNKNSVPMAVSIVKREQIAESSESAILPILNGQVPGLFVTERGVTGFGVSTGAAGQITMRGIGGSPTRGVLMLIDGHPQYMGIFGHPLADSYVASDIEKVEVIRGPASILYGSNAMGGVINLITRKQVQDGFHGNSNISYGSYNTQKYMVSAGYKKNKFSIFTSFNHDQTDGHRDTSDFKINNGYIKLGFKLDQNIQANTDFSIANFKTSDPGPDTLNAIAGNNLDIVRGYWALDIENEYEKFSGVAKLFYNFGKHDISDGFHSTDANFGFNLHETAKLFNGNSLTFGADYMQFGGKAENVKAMKGEGVVFKDTILYEAGIYGFVQQTLFEKLTLNVGLRLQNHEVYGKKWIPSGGFAFQLTPQTTWKASFSKGYRSPTIQELYIWAHNSNLDPEEIMSYETGVLQAFLSGKINIELTGFLIEGDNLIVTVPLKGVQNAGEVSNKGIELAVNALPVKNLGINLTYSFIDMKTPVYATPKHHFFTSCRYRWNKFLVITSIEYVKDLDTDVSSDTYFQEYTMLNAKFAYQIWKYTDIYISAENLLNQTYETNRYYPMPGTTIFAGVNFKF